MFFFFVCLVVCFCLSNAKADKFQFSKFSNLKRTWHLSKCLSWWQWIIHFIFNGLFLKIILFVGLLEKFFFLFVCFYCNTHKLLSGVDIWVVWGSSLWFILIKYYCTYFMSTLTLNLSLFSGPCILWNATTKSNYLYAFDYLANKALLTFERCVQTFVILAAAAFWGSDSDSK